MMTMGTNVPGARSAAGKDIDGGSDGGACGLRREGSEGAVTPKSSSGVLAD